VISQELTYIIKQDIAGVNKQIADLQKYVKQHGAGGSGSRTLEQKQTDEHEANVVMLLQSKLANVSMSFKDVLELRTQVGRSFSIFPATEMVFLQNMKESKDRTEQFMHSAASSANQAPSSSSTS
jgi:syntaxin 5